MSRMWLGITIGAAFAMGVATGWVGRSVRMQIVTGTQIRNYADLQFWTSALGEFHEQRGTYPETLREAAALKWPTTGRPARDYIDNYTRPIIYMRVGDGFVLASLGSDGVSDSPSLEAWRTSGIYCSSPCYESARDTIITEKGLVQGCAK